MGTPREPFLKQGDRVLHRRVDKVGTVLAMTRGLDVDRAVIGFDDGDFEKGIPASECTLLPKFAIHIGPSGSTFVKDYDFFVQQGGTTDDWGKHWKIIQARDLDDARVIAIKEPGAVPGLYCAKCGKDDTKCVCK